MKKKEYESDSRRRQVETTKRRKGADFYKRIAPGTFTKRTGKLAIWKRWYPERFNTNGDILEEWEDQIDVGN